ncbi:MAG: hypothetical protein ACLP1D_03920 [Xanthobacteraceae bacterium]
MNKLLAFLTAVALCAAQSPPLHAQTVVAPVAAAAGSAYVGKKVVGACLSHPVLCAATAVVGTAYAYKATQNVRRLDAETPACSEGYIPLYRAVGSIEHAEIAVIQRYVIVPGGMTVKEFFFDLTNAQWLAAFNQRYESSPTKEIFIVTSKVCATTLALGEKFSDSNRSAIAFPVDALKLVNLDASRTGGIQTIWTTGAAK